MVVRAWLQAVLLFIGLASSTMAQQQPETLSLLDKLLVPPPLSADTRRQLEADLAAARAAYDRNPQDVDAAIWLGRRTAYLSRFGEAIEIYTRAIEAHPDEPRLYRHRGHRYITIRKFDLAIKDLRKAADLVEGTPDEIEPDGQPNDRNVPTSTLQTNIYYHLGLAHYLKAEFPQARDAYRTCLGLAKNPDMQVATSAWLYMTLRRMKLDDEARQALQPISAGMDVIENAPYHRLLLFYKGELPENQLTGKGSERVIYAYGLANRELWSGAHDKAKEGMKRIVEKRIDDWPAFAYIAAEADLVRLQKGDHKHKPKKK
jgi:tetratricopeptide (TPR) repeat protein